MGEKIQNWFNNEELKKLVEIFGTTDKQRIQELLKQNILNDKKQTDLDTQLKELRIRKLKADCRIQEHRATYYETFDAPPSPQGENAIKNYGNGTTTSRPTTRTEQDKIMQHFAPIEHQLNEIYAMCIFCDNLIYGNSNGDCISKCGIHLQGMHPKEILKD